MDIEKTIKAMTLEDKVALGSGKNFWNTKAMPQYGLDSIMVSDGPHGLRKQNDTGDMLGINESIPATSFPTAVSSACSWDKELLKKEGETIAREGAANNVSVVLGPGANIKRNPLCGRNFEYFSEDPYLTGKLAASFIQGAESTGIGTSLKHFAFNNQEYKRFSSDSILDERAMREIYLSGFETAVKEGKPSTIMCAYNKINGEYCSDSKILLTDILRDEWGFDGLVVTDWGAMSDRIKAYEAGCDLSMPGGSSFMEKETVQAVKTGNLEEKYVDNSVERLLKLVARGKNGIQNAVSVNMEEHYNLARQVAEESGVLLKNEGQILPLSEADNIVFVGNMAKEVRYQGAGSSHINPWKLTSVIDACPEIPFVQGCLKDGSSTEELLEEVRRASRNADKVVVFAGLTDNYESEGFDRDNMHMPQGHVDMIEAATQENENVVVVLMCGSSVEVSWLDKVKGLLYMGLPGEAAGEAISNLLFGRVNPSGKLAETWAMKYEDCICSSYYSGDKKDAQYRESVFVGYRYYTSAKKQARFPFGYGLSYTTFEYSDLQVEGDKVSCVITNTGAVAGKEIVQLYVEAVDSKVYRPVRELKGFEKIELAPQESKRVEFFLDDRSFAIWENGWKVPTGTYRIAIGSNCENMLLSEEVERNGDAIETNAPIWYSTLDGIPTKKDFEVLIGREIVEKLLKKGAFTMDNTVKEMMEYSLFMKLMYKATEMVMVGGPFSKKDKNDPEVRMTMSCAMDCSIRGMGISGGIKNSIMEGLLEIGNGHFFKGIVTMLK